MEEWKYQLWIYYASMDEWKMSGFFKTPEEAKEAVSPLMSHEIIMVHVINMGKGKEHG